MNQEAEAVLGQSLSEDTHEHVHRDDIGSRMGMWLFLLTELLLFGGMFLLYASYRFLYPDGFRAAAIELNTFIGAMNTIILLTSSLSVALSIAALQKGQKKLCIYLLYFTLLSGLVFLINKYFEWGTKFQHGIYPKGPALENMSQGQIMYFGLYYVMTGLHGLHVIAGMVFISIVLALVIKNKLTSTNYTKLENSGLYWHLVDIIWIFLFPLFYLIH
ncbi:MAG: cytochrome c oxidase subunit 3 [Ignavibacteria bacterium]|jgi:cytochrome c oxidase subunit 3